MRFIFVVLFATGLGCGPSSGRPGSGGADACTGLQCRIVDCAKTQRQPTTITGTVYAPNRTLALYGVTVYIPNADPAPFTDGATCSRCGGTPPPDSVVSVLSDEAGKFTLTNVPTGVNVPLVIQVGKWRRQVTIPMVSACMDNPQSPELTSLPRNQTEGDIPKIAIATGNCDALECLVRKIGVSDAEFTSDSGAGRVHLYVANGASRLANSTLLSSATTLWGTVEKLKQYDLTMFSCECGAQADQKPQAAMNALKAYADLGGRAFLSHYHNIWIVGERANPSHAPAVWPSIATCPDDAFTTANGTIDQINNPKGVAFATWMVNVMGSPSLGNIPIMNGRQTCTSVDNTKAERWVHSPEFFTGTTLVPQNFQFTTPNELPKEQRCGKVVFSDMHVASGSTSGLPSGDVFPTGCATGAMSPQEKALAFMFFDIASCVGELF